MIKPILCYVVVFAFLGLWDPAVAQVDTRYDVINAEYNFAETALATSTKEAFLTHLAPSGWIVRDGVLVNGIDEWKARQPNTNALLSWYPSFVDVAASGDLALSTGPWEFRQTRTDATPAAFGHFVSIWKKQTNGEWKVAIDIGVSHPAPAVKEAPLSRTTSGANRMNEVVRLKLPRSTQELIRLEKELIANLEREGPVVIAKALADEARVYRFNALPLLGRAAKDATLAEAPEQHTFSVMGGDIARSGDWGYVYGSVSISGRDKSKEPTKAAYMRVWEKDRGKWKIFLEVITS